MTAPYPLVFRPMLFPKVWGGRRLERLGKALPPGERVGESWELADLDATSASGAGGAAARSVIAEGPLAGRTLHDAMDLWGRDLLGAAATGSGAFPLLIKYLDAREHLSVQVHPSPAYAASHPEAHLKTECWYVLDAEEGGVIFKGVREGVTRDEFERRIADGTVADAMVAVPAVKGEMHELPSGTCHALGAGVLVAEVQTPSDTTFRVYDWAREYGRAGRELHVRQALDCIDFGPAPGATRFGEGAHACTLVSNRHFMVREVRTRQKIAVGAAGPPVCGVFMALAGHGAARFAGLPDLPLSPGRTALVPASLMGSFELVPAIGTLTLLLVYPGAVSGAARA